MILLTRKKNREIIEMPSIDRTTPVLAFSRGMIIIASDSIMYLFNCSDSPFMNVKLIRKDVKYPNESKRLLDKPYPRSRARRSYALDNISLGEYLTFNSKTKSRKGWK